ncbi:hypothetical protein DFH09DRAFT_1088980 [Mycena vulgaris]|nr:hypothetical protein DFH09DRAFT_1088980 [Mycena vulgaris]
MAGNLPKVVEIPTLSVEHSLIHREINTPREHQKRIPNRPEKLSLPPNNLPVSSLIKFQLLPQRKSTVYSDLTDYLAELPPTLTTFNVTEIVVPPSVVVKALGRVSGSKHTRSADHARNWQVVRAPRCFELNAPCAREKIVF